MLVKKIFTYRLLGFVIAFLFLLNSEVSVAQWTLDVMGTVKKKETKKRLEGATITVKRNGNLFKTITSPANGKFEVSLLPDAIYTIEFSKPGHVTKRMEISTKNVPPEDAKYGFDFPMEMNLFEKIDGLDVSILNQPIAKVAFDPATGIIDYDKGYTNSIKKELDRLTKELEERLKLAEAARKEKQKNYDAAIISADKAFNTEKWEEAKPFYEKAASIFPNEAYPTEQMTEIKAQLNKIAGENKAYSDAIAVADIAFQAKEWDRATANYQKALDLKEQEKYPKDKIKEIETIVANQQKVDEDYNDAIASADQSFGEKNYDKAIESYKKAAALKSYEKYPQDKLKEIDTILADLAQKEKGYNDAIAEADNYFKGKEYQKAINSYNKALSFKFDEEYPKDKKEEASNLLASLKELQDNYDKFIVDADAAFKRKDYNEAKSNYQEASDIFSNEQYPKDKLAEIESIVNAAAKLDEEYSVAVAQGDKAFGQENYELAQTAFKKALTLKAEEEEYPQEKLDEIKSLLEELATKKAEEEANALAQKTIDDKYNAFITSADNSFGSKDYENAKKNYNAALEVKSDEQYPQDKLDEIEELLAELEQKKEEEDAVALAQKELDDKYNELINLADKAFSDKAYDDAIENYTEASDVKSDEQYPLNKIKEIEELLAALEKQKEDEELAAESEKKKREYYEALVAEADGELVNKNYDEASSKYNQAIGVIPEEQYPKDKIQEIKNILAKIEADEENANLAQKQLDDKYNKLVIEGDNAFGSKDYTKAKFKYQAALNVKEDEGYPQDQLDKIEEILTDLAQKEAEITLTNNALKQKQEQYNSFIKIADADFSNKRYKKAISSYEQALSIMPDKEYPKQKIDEITQLLKALAAKEKSENEAAFAEKEKKKKYDKLIYDGDRAMKLKKYTSAQTKFNDALAIYPDKKYPSDRLAEIMKLLKNKPEEVVVEVEKTNNDGPRAKITDAKEKEIEAKMAALLGKKNAEIAKVQQKEKERYEHQEEIRISGAITRTKEAEDQLDRYTDDIIAQTERGNKYHLENSETLLATTKILEKAEKERIKNADKRREEADADFADYTKQEIEFKQEQKELDEKKVKNHNVFVNDVTEAKLVMIERGDKLRADNRKGIQKIINDNSKNKARSKKRSEEMELDVQKYKKDLAKAEEVRISASIDRTNKNEKDLEKLANEMNKLKEKKAKGYKVNDKELDKFRARIEKLENKRQKKAEKFRQKNKKVKEKNEQDFVKNSKRKNKQYYKDVKQLDKFKKVVVKQELANQKKADKRRTKSNKDIVKAKEKLGVANKSQEKRYKEFKVKLDEERKRNNEFNSDLQSLEREKILLANVELNTYYRGEKKLSQDDELTKKYPQGITEETVESGNSIAIKRIKVTGNHADVYERVFYTWGGTFFYKNGINITQSLWNKESIEK